MPTRSPISLVDRLQTLPPLRSHSTPPGGHGECLVRELKGPEMEWMLGAAGFEIVASAAFNYSLFGLAEISGADLGNYGAMQADPTMRELPFHGAVARAAGETRPV